MQSRVARDATMTVEGLVDWRGRPVNTKWHGGVRAALFLHVLVVLMHTANIANLMNLVSYLHGTMHMGVARSSTIATDFIGAMSMFSLVGAFISDSYIKRFHTMLIFAPLEILGYGLLTIQAHYQSLHPAQCDINKENNNCVEVHGFNFVLLNIGLYTVTFGEGCLRGCIAPLGGDQFDDDDPIEQRQKISFFNWYTFAISFGGFLGLIFVVWVENNKGWDTGFALCTLLVFTGLIVTACGFPFYRNQIPTGSPLTRILQVFVAAYRKRNISLTDYRVSEEVSRTRGFRFLDKATIDNGEKGDWSFCSTTQVEEIKIILRMLPIFLSSTVGYLPFSLLMTFTVQQGGTMNTQLGKIHISPASLFVIPITFQMVTLVIYDRMIVPLLRKLTGYPGGITHLQRVGIGFVFAAVATAVAALVETKRKKVAIDHGLIDSSTGIPMSVFWLGLQFFFLGIIDVTSFVGLLEFFYSEISTRMKSIGTSIFFCILGLSAWLSSFLINVVNKVTRNGEGKGWLDGANLNKSHLDRFYWLLSVIGLLSFLNYAYWANKYVCRYNPGIVTEDVERSKRETDTI
ncbi:protein NRT1/ PTR FAMILY 4.6-like isoform X1 [Carex littledalei]|uniref:Protein NRT1/ PTR FAMILY 4.6-like isoform X1 n=1 Tax=Carex littledalei TaxID=544730 RepID=A0A833QM01_9POAL|nr:protein NRT1/ PTR FAMILY 4.6-like isoform X1 [Carex littledalei]